MGLPETSSAARITAAVRASLSSKASTITGPDRNASSRSEFNAVRALLARRKQ